MTREQHAKAGCDPHPELRVEKTLIDQARAISERRDKVQELVRNAKENEGKIKEEIHDRVMRDYDTRLQAVAGELEPVTAKICTALKGVAGREVELKGRLEQIKDEIEEQRFRCSIGEFSEAESAPVERQKEQVREELEGKLAVVAETYEQCRAFISAEAFEQALRQGSAGPAKPPPPPPDADDFEADELPNAGVPIDPITLIQSLKHQKAVAPPNAEPKLEPKAEPPKAEPQVERSAEAKPEHAAAAKHESKQEPKPEPEAKREPQPSRPSAPPDGVLLSRKAPGGPHLRMNRDGQVEVYPLGKALSIGRSSKSDIVLGLAGVSRNHAQVVQRPEGGYSIVDVSGGGGLAVNGKRTKESELRGGDKITICTCELEVVIDS